MEARQTGTSEPMPQGISFSYDPRAGYTPGTEIRGPVNAMLGYSATLANFKIPHTFKQEGPEGVVNITGGSPTDNGFAEVPVDGWSMPRNELQKDIYESDIALRIEDVKRGSLGAIRHDIDLMNQGLPTIADKPSTGPNDTHFTLDPSTQPDVLKLTSLILRGTSGFPVSKPILRHTQTISENYAGTGFIFTNEECVYSFTKLMAEVNSFPVKPPRWIYDRIEVLGDNAPTARNGYFYGWRKLPVDGNQAARYKSEISTEYHLDQWSSTLFTLIQ